MSSASLPLDPPEQFAALVYCLIQDQLVNSEDWIAWATDELMRAEGAPSWLAELTTTRSADAALEIIGPICSRPSSAERLGCLWLSFTLRALTSLELLEAALDAVGGWDTGGGFVPYQQELMALLRRVEALSSATTSNSRDSFDEIERDARLLLDPLGDLVFARANKRITLSHLEAT